MAKVVQPLMSAKASGKLGDAVVHFTWHGINAIRTWVKPANPKTEAQQAQRGKMTDAVAEFHNAEYNALDRTAWNRFARTMATAMTGFNVMVKCFVKAVIEGLTWVRLAHAATSNVTGSGFTVTIDSPENATAVLYYGISDTYMPTAVDGSYLTGTWTFNLSGLSSGVNYCFYIKNTAATKAGRTGVYLQRTS